MLGWFGNTKKTFNIEVDIHSHLIPGIDDGSRSIEESIEILRDFEKLGFKKIITNRIKASKINHSSNCLPKARDFGRTIS